MYNYIIIKIQRNLPFSKIPYYLHKKYNDYNNSLICDKISEDDLTIISFIKDEQNEYKKYFKNIANNTIKKLIPLPSNIIV